MYFFNAGRVAPLREFEAIIPYIISSLYVFPPVAGDGDSDFFLGSVSVVLFFGDIVIRCLLISLFPD